MNATIRTPSNDRASSSADTQIRLQQTLKPNHYLSLAFGAIIGVAWIVVLGDWLARAGPVGTILGFVVGGAIIIVVGMCYAEMSGRFPASGAEIVYANEVFGVLPAFAVGWFLVLFWISVTAFEAISIYWILDQLGWSFAPTPLYVILGHTITVGAVITGCAGMVIFTVINYLGASWVARFQNLVNTVFLVGAALFLSAGIGSGNVDNIVASDAMSFSTNAWMGSIWIIATCPFWLSGFQIIPQTIEERAPGADVTTIGRMIMLAIGLAVLFYVLVIVASSMAAPWQTLVNADLAAAAAIESAFGGGLLYQLVLFAAMLGLLTTWNASFVTAARLLLALGRARLLPQSFAAIHKKHGSPHIAIFFVSAVGFFGLFLGRGAIVPISNTSSICISAAFALTCFAVLRLRGSHPPTGIGYVVPGKRALPFIGLIGSIAMAAFAFADPLLKAEGGLPVEWILLGTWSAIGSFFWLGFKKERLLLSKSRRRRMLLGARDLAD